MKSDKFVRLIKSNLVDFDLIKFILIDLGCFLLVQYCFVAIFCGCVVWLYVSLIKVGILQDYMAK